VRGHDLERLEDRLRVLLLVPDDQLVHEAVVQQPVVRRGEVGQLELAERSRPHVIHVAQRILAAQVWEGASFLARRGGGVIDDAQVVAQGGTLEGRLHEPQVLERRDVPEVPDDRAHERIVDGVQRVVGELLDECQRTCADCLEAIRDRLARCRGMRRGGG
jgi:hypothetical protein